MCKARHQADLHAQSFSRTGKHVVEPTSTNARRTDQSASYDLVSTRYGEPESALTANRSHISAPDIQIPAWVS